MSERPLKERLGQPALPETYGVDRVHATAISPRRLAWHWELSGPGRGTIDARQRGRMVLRLVPAAAGSATRDIATLEGTAGRGYSDVAPGRTVVLRIHWVPDLGPERVLAESDPVRAPWESADDLGGSDSMRSTGHALRPVAVDGPRSTAPWTSEEGS